MQITVENIKCGGCANSIKKSLKQVEGINDLTVDVDNGIITLDAADTLRQTVVNKLSQMGYPETGHNDVMKRAKSFVSCAIGRMSSDES